MTHKRVWNANVHYHFLILDAIPSGSSRILDVGCGDGILSAQLIEAGVAQVIGLDIDGPVLGRASARDCCRGIQWLRADVLEAPLKPESFDAVVSVSALHHMDASAALRRLADLVKPSGVVAIVGLAANDWWNWPYTLLGAAARAILGFVYGRWKHTAPISWPPPLTYHQMRDLAQRSLPGAQYHHHLLGRYSLVWRKPNR
jgi:2-polyprenyl-3-methyl-5-hydroxy-6-metoxy-1,4-benzoquinol methylase